jgi:Na+/H+ antiporter NhaC
VISRIAESIVRDDWSAIPDKSVRVHIEPPLFTWTSIIRSALALAPPVIVLTLLLTKAPVVDEMQGAAWIFSIVGLIYGIASLIPALDRGGPGVVSGAVDAATFLASRRSTPGG